MKKLIVMLMLAFITLTATAQKVSYLRANHLQLGLIDPKTKKVTWEKDKQTVSILIQVEAAKITIYSNKLQIYQVLSLETSTNEMSKWYCIDSRGLYCNVYTYTVKELPSIIFIAVEFDDLIFYYETTIK